MAFTTDVGDHGRAITNDVAPAMIPYSKVKTLRVGDKGENVYAITKDYYPQYPSYWKHGSVIMTEIDGVQYEVAFLLDEHTGVIRDISYQNHEAEHVMDVNRP